MGKNNGVCAKCGGQHSGSHVSYCRPCYNAYKRVADRKPEIVAKRRIRDLAMTRANPKKYADKMRRIRHQDIEKARAYAREYRKRNPERVREWDRKKAEKRKSAKGSGAVSARKWQEICDFFGNKCFYCGIQGVKLTVDHAIPLSRGGDNATINLRPACRKCNGEKWARTPEEFNEYRKTRNIPYQSSEINSA